MIQWHETESNLCIFISLNQMGSLNSLKTSVWKYTCNCFKIKKKLIENPKDYV